MRTPHPLSRLLRVVCALGLGAGSTVGVALRAGAQSATTTTTTPAPSIVVSLTLEVPLGTSLASLPLGANRLIVNVTNTGPTPLTNEQIVVRVGVRPDAIVSVRDLAGLVGVLDSTTGTWFHTIPSITPAGTASFVVTWTKACPGRFPVAARVADTVASQVGAWTGTPVGLVCPADETTAPQPASYYQLPWPPMANTATTVAPTTSTIAAVVETTTTRPNSATTTRQPLPPTSTTTTSRVATTRAVPSTVVIVCKTVGTTRYCAPKSTQRTTTTRRRRPKTPSTAALRAPGPLRPPVVTTRPPATTRP